MTPYRDDYDALKARHASLSEELRVTKEKTSELDALKENEAQLTRELEESQKKLDRIPSRRSLPLLETIRIASPCNADWEKMIGDDQIRFCAHCQKDVYNLSGMAREEAETLIREREGELCVRLYRRADGTVLTADCPVGVRKKRVRRVAIATVGGGLMAAGAMLAWSSESESEQMVMGSIEAQEVVMGEILAEPEPSGDQIEEVMGGMPPPELSATPPAPSAKPGGIHVRMGKMVLRPKPMPKPVTPPSSNAPLHKGDSPQSPNSR